MSYHGMFLDLVSKVERELDLAEFERRKRWGMFEHEPRRPGPRAWAAARLMSLALRLDRHAGEQAARALVPSLGRVQG